MSQENVETARRGIDAFAELATTDFGWFPAMVGIIEGDSYRGREGIEKSFEDIGSAWEELRLLGDEFRDLGDRVIMLGRIEGRGRGSGVQVDAPIGVVIDFRGGKVSVSRGYLDHGEALRAAALPE
jgi:ketosteroid isomerase-like protein